MASIYPKIAIIGAGPGGLTLARLLQRAQILVFLFESEPSHSARQQGGSLDLHEDSGQLALREAGLGDALASLIRVGEDVMRVSEPSGEVILDESMEGGPGSPGGGPVSGAEKLDGQDGQGGPGRPGETRPEVDRIALRAALLDSLEPDTIRWGKKLSSVTPSSSSPTATYDLHFADGTIEHDYNLVVGADGAWSRVRPLLTDVNPFYSGIGGIEVRLRDANTRNPELAQFVGPGNHFAFGDGKALFAQRNGDGSIRLYALKLAPETWLLQDSGYDWTDPKSKDAFCAADYGSWASIQQDLILKADPDVVPRNLYMLPVGLRWSPRPGVTLLGDAAHLMTPFAGEGVNLAMRDALTLAREIIKAVTSSTTSPQDVTARLAAGTQAYEEKMFKYSTESAGETKRNLDSLFGPGGARAFLQAMGPPPQ